MIGRSSRVGCLTLVMACIACAAPAQGPSSGSPSGGPTAAPKRIRAALMSDPPSLNNSVNQTVAGGKTYAGVREIENLLNDGLTMADGRGGVHAKLADAVPSVENGLWRVLPDGRMEIEWRIRAGVRWQDGTPFTPDDVVFSMRVAQDRDLPFLPRVGYDLIEQVEGPDARTVRAHLKQPFIEADLMFSSRELLPKHLLEPVLNESKAEFAHHPFWSTGFVGMGAFKLREYVRGSHLVLEAYDAYVLGRPHVDEIEILFRPDPNTLAANILAGTVELTFGSSLSLQTALQVGEQWRDGRVEVANSSETALHIFPQLNNPRPAVIADLSFRRALLHAIDRQEIVDSIMAGRAHIAHGIYWDVNDREYPEIEGGIVRYSYDPARATRMLEELGYTRGADGFLRDRANQKLAVELRGLSVYQAGVKTIFPVAAYWQRIGVEVEAFLVPEQRTGDREYRATRPGFDITISPQNLARIHGREAPLAENNFRGNNRAGYVNPEFDSLIDAYFVTIPWQERTAILSQVVRHMTDRVITMGLFFDVNSAMIGQHLANVHTGARGVEVWNATEWDLVRSR